MSEIADCYHLRREDSYIVLECIKQAKERVAIEATDPPREYKQLTEIEQKILAYQREIETENKT